MKSFFKALGYVLLAAVIIVLCVAAFYGGIFIMVLMGIGTVLYFLTNIFTFVDNDEQG